MERGFTSGGVRDGDGGRGIFTVSGQQLEEEQILTREQYVSGDDLQRGLLHVGPRWSLFGRTCGRTIRCGP